MLPRRPLGVACVCTRTLGALRSNEGGGRQERREVLLMWVDLGICYGTGEAWLVQNICIIQKAFFTSVYFIIMKKKPSTDIFILERENGEGQESRLN